MSPDPLAGNKSNPQSLNRYSHASNNPVRNTDPTGMYVCEDSEKCDSKNDQNFKHALSDARLAASRISDGGERLAATNAINSYGAEGVDNGVNVRFDAAVSGGVTEVSGTANGENDANNDNPSKQNINVTFNSNEVAGPLGSALVAHEGSHVGDGARWVSSGFSDAFNPTRYHTEMDAYHVEFNIIQHIPGQYLGFGNPAMGGVPVLYGEPWSDAWPGVRDMLKNNPPYLITPNSTIPAFVKGGEVPR